VLGSLKIACRGGQNHPLDRERVDAHYRDAFGEHLW